MAYYCHAAPVTRTSGSHFLHAVTSVSVIVLFNEINFKLNGMYQLSTIQI